MQWGPQQAYELDVKGYLVVRGAFSDGEVDRLADALRSIEELGVDVPCAYCPSWTPAVHELRLLNLLEVGDDFLKLIDDPRITTAIDALVPSPYRLTEAFSISRERGPGIPLHSIGIAAYRSGDGRPQCDHMTAIVNLTDCGPEDGPLVVFEGSHKLGVRFPFARVDPRWQLPEHDAEFRDGFLEGVADGLPVPWERIPGYREVRVRRGDLVFLSQSLWHGAKEHRSETVRRTLYFSYSPYHFANWHGIQYSSQLLARANDRQRELLSGPFVGSRYEAVRTDLPARMEFPVIPQSEASHDRFRRGEAANGHMPKGVFEDMVVRASECGEIKELRGSCQFDLRGGDGGTWCLHLDGGRASVHHGAESEPDAVVEMSTADFLEVAAGDRDPVELFYRGGLVARGDIRLVMGIANLWHAS